MALPNVTTDTHALRTPAGFAAAYRAHARSILIFHVRRTYDPETALDLTAETFAQAYEARRRFRGATEEEVAAWLFGIARYVLARYLRRGGAERRALTRLGVEVPSLEPDVLITDNPDREADRPTRSRRVSAPPAGMAILSVLNQKGGNEVDAQTRDLQIEVAPVGSEILESRR